MLTRSFFWLMCAVALIFLTFNHYGVVFAELHSFYAKAKMVYYILAFVFVICFILSLLIFNNSKSHMGIKAVWDGFVYNFELITNRSDVSANYASVCVIWIVSQVGALVDEGIFLHPVYFIVFLFVTNKLARKPHKFINKDRLYSAKLDKSHGHEPTVASVDYTRVKRRNNE